MKVCDNGTTRDVSDPLCDEEAIKITVQKRPTALVYSGSTSTQYSDSTVVQAVDRLTGVLYSIGGNYQFQVDVTDNGEPGSSWVTPPDQYAIRVWNLSGTYCELGNTYDGKGSLLAPLDIAGGNIQVKAEK